MTSDPYERPSGTTDTTVAAVGLLTEAFEWLQRARGRIYDLHQMIGHADELFGQAAHQLREAGHDDEAALVEREVVGRNVIEGRWSFQLIDEAADHFFDPIAAIERDVRERLLAGRRHVHEAEMKADRVTPDDDAHRLRPRHHHASG